MKLNTAAILFCACLLEASSPVLGAGLRHLANDNGKGNGKNNAPVGNEDLESIVAEAVIETEKNTGNGNSNGNSNGNANGSSNGNNGNGKANANSDNENTSGGVSEVLEDTPGEDIPEVLEETTMLETLTENSEDDIEYIAKKSGMALLETRLLLEQQRDFSALVADLQEDDGFTEAVMPENLDGEFVIKFKNGVVPGNRLGQIEGFKKKNSRAQVNTVATRLSRKDAEARGQRLAAKLKRKGYGQVGYSISGDKLDIVATMSPNDDTLRGNSGKVPPGQAAKLLDLEEEDEDLWEMQMVVESEDALLHIEEHTYGGRKISGANGECTTAFSVKSVSTTDTGITTAAHCSGMNLYDAVPPESDYSTTFKKQHFGAYGDMEWHTTPHWDAPVYYGNVNSILPVRSVAGSISVNEWVCFYSRRQGQRTCDQVLRTSVSTGSSSQMVAMKNDNSVGGDSGGPWSFYDKAYGIHQGDSSICDVDGCRLRNVWSRVSFLPVALGVRVRTQT